LFLRLLFFSTGDRYVMPETRISESCYCVILCSVVAFCIAGCFATFVVIALVAQ